MVVYKTITIKTRNGRDLLTEEQRAEDDVLGLTSDSHKLFIASRMKVYLYCIGIKILLTRRGAEIN